MMMIYVLFYNLQYITTYITAMWCIYVIIVLMSANM